jgi:GNAT superfamily N-acetyltransferase
MKTFQIRPITKEDHNWVVSLLTVQWGSARIVTHGKVFQADQLPGFIAIQNDKPVGLITYRIDGKECEIGSINSLVEKIGIGTALVQAVRAVVQKAGCCRLWLITTNANTDALHFWKKRGFVLAAVYLGAVEHSRKLKPEIPLLEDNGIPIRDEIELELLL